MSIEESIRRSSSEYSASSSISYDRVDIGQSEKSKARIKLYLNLFKYWKFRLVLFPSALFGFVPLASMAIIGQILSLHSQYILDGINTLHQIQTYCLYVLIVAACAAFSKFFSAYLWVRIGSEYTIDLKKDLFENMMRSEVAFFDTNPIGGIMTLLGEDSQLVQDAFGTIKGQQIANFAQFIGGIILSYVFQWRMALIATCIVPFTTITIKVLSKFIDKHINLKFYHVSESMTIAEETLSSIRTVRGANREDKEIKRFMKETHKVYDEDSKIGYWITALMTTILTALWAMLVGNMYYGGTLVKKGLMANGDLFSVFAFLIFGCMGIIECQTSLQGEQKAIASGARILKLIEHIPDIPFDGGEEIEDFKGHIEFRNVSFKYPTRNVYVLKNVSFEIKPGQIGALVGHSGSGKSTCVQLLERFYDPTDGLILLDGVDITTLNPHWLHQKLSLVAQEPSLFQMSIKENIKYGARNATDEQVEMAAEMANASKFIKKLDKGFDQFVGEKGSTLSGGQRQRIAIARALIKDPVILITDEATSALDAASEKLVQGALDKVMQNRTSVVVAHRLTTIRNAHIIYVFDAGEIVETGVHDELVERRGFYYELVRRQLNQNDTNIESLNVEEETESIEKCDNISSDEVEELSTYSSSSESDS